MGKRKKLQNLVKIDLGEDIFETEVTLPILVQQSSQDGRRMRQTVYKIPAPREGPPAPTFDPSPEYGATQDCASEECDAMDELDGLERVSSHFSLEYILTRPPLSVGPSTRLAH